MLEYGFIRLQLSVFAGSVSDTRWKALLRWMQKEVVPRFVPDDKLLYLPLSSGQAANFSFLPAPPDDWNALVDPPNTLFV